MKKLIRLEILKCWTLLFILVTYQVNVYFLGRICKHKHWEKCGENYFLQTFKKYCFSTFQVSLSLQQPETTESNPALHRPKVLFNMSDRFSDVLTIDYLLLTSRTFEKQQSSKNKVSKEPQRPPGAKPSYLLPEDKDSVPRDIQSDQPFRPFSFQQFERVSAETSESSRLTERRKEKMIIIRKQQRDRLVKKPIKRIRKQIRKISAHLHDI